MANLTVSDLRKKLKGIKGSLPVYWADHDHGKYETNASLGSVLVLNQKDDPEFAKSIHNREFLIEGEYVCLRP